MATQLLHLSMKGSMRKVHRLFEEGVGNTELYDAERGTQIHEKYSEKTFSIHKYYFYVLTTKYISTLVIIQKLSMLEQRTSNLHIEYKTFTFATCDY